MQEAGHLQGLVIQMEAGDDRPGSDIHVMTEETSPCDGEAVIKGNLLEGERL